MCWLCSQLSKSFWASDGGLILVRELDERVGFGDLIAQHLTDSRHGKNTQLPLADPLRQSVYSRIAGCRAALARSDVPADRFGKDLGCAGAARVGCTMLGYRKPKWKFRLNMSIA
jgi:hypothetical protein